MLSLQKKLCRRKFELNHTDRNGMDNSIRENHTNVASNKNAHFIQAEEKKSEWVTCRRFLCFK